MAPDFRAAPRRFSPVFWIASLGLAACNSWTPVEPGLNSTVNSTQTGSNCASCHNYPVGGINHQFHLLHTDSLKNGNGPITCLDCHSSSLKEKDQIVFDSIYMDPAGAQHSAYDSGSYVWFRNAVTAGTYTLAKVDTLVHHRPVPVVGPPQRVAYLQEWITALDHLNGTVDVEFDSRDSDPARYRGSSAQFDPVYETCSSVACHKNGTPYRWPAPSKGLTGLNITTATQ